MKTGDWGRRAAEERRVVVTDRGRPAAMLVPVDGQTGGIGLAQRFLLSASVALPKVVSDSTGSLSEADTHQSAAEP